MCMWVPSIAPAALARLESSENVSIHVLVFALLTQNFMYSFLSSNKARGPFLEAPGNYRAR